MTTFDVHTDKAIRELRTRLDQAERERGELHAALRNVLAALGNGSGATAQAGVEFLVNTWHEVAAVVGELRRDRDEARRALRAIATAFGCEPDDPDDLAEAARMLVAERDEARAALAAAEMERDVAWVRACDTNDGVANINRGLGLRDKHRAWTIVLLAQGTGSTATDADIAAAIRAARGAR